MEKRLLCISKKGERNSGKRFPSAARFNCSVHTDSIFGGLAAFCNARRRKAPRLMTSLHNEHKWEEEKRSRLPMTFPATRTKLHNSGHELPSFFCLSSRKHTIRRKVIIRKRREHNGACGTSTSNNNVPIATHALFGSPNAHTMLTTSLLLPLEKCVSTFAAYAIAASLIYIGWGRGWVITWDFFEAGQRKKKRKRGAETKKPSWRHIYRELWRFLGVFGTHHGPSCWKSKRLASGAKIMD